MKKMQHIDFFSLGDTCAETWAIVIKWLKHAQCRLLHLHSAVDRHMIHDHALFQPAHGYWITLHRTAQHAHKQSPVISCNRPDVSWIRCTHACLYRITTAGSTHTHRERQRDLGPVGRCVLGTSHCWGTYNWAVLTCPGQFHLHQHATQLD